MQLAFVIVLLQNQVQYTVFQYWEYETNIKCNLGCRIILKHRNNIHTFYITDKLHK